MPQNTGRFATKANSAGTFWAIIPSASATFVLASLDTGKLEALDWYEKLCFAVTRWYKGQCVKYAKKNEPCDATNTVCLDLDNPLALTCGKSNICECSAGFYERAEGCRLKAVVNESEFLENPFSRLDFRQFQRVQFLMIVFQRRVFLRTKPSLVIVSWACVLLIPARLLSWIR